MQQDSCVTEAFGEHLSDPFLADGALLPRPSALRIVRERLGDPTQPAGRTDSLACSLDLGSTLLDLAGLPAYDGIQGVSLAPTLADPSATVRDHLLIEDDLPPGLAALMRTPDKTRTVITADGTKYTRHRNGDDMLFDLLADHDELHPITADATRRAQAVDVLASAVIEASDSARGAPTG